MARSGWVSSSAPAQAIHNAGPGLLLTCVVGGVAIFFIMRALGELLTYRPVAGSFATYADEFCGPFVGFVTAMLWLQPDTRVALYAAPLWFGLLALCYFGARPQAVTAPDKIPAPRP